MNRPAERFPILRPPQRAACILAAALSTAAVNASLFGLFHSASHERWLNPTPELLSAKAQCDALPGRTERTHCTQAVVARARTATERPVQLASR